MIQEHERDGIAWKTEWKALPECCLIAGAVLFQSRNLLAGLRVDQEAMAANLDMMRGYLLSERVMLELGKKVGKDHAHEWVYEASMRGIESKIDFSTAMHNHAQISKALTDEEIAEFTDPANYLGQVGASIDRTLANQRESGWMREDASESI